MQPHVDWHRLGDDRWLGIEHYPARGRRALCIVHGFRAWHRWGFLPLVAQWFAERGTAAYVLALPSSGYGPDGFSAGRFEQATITGDRAALRLAVEAVRADSTCVAGLGHSRGGLLLLLEHAAFDCIALWAPPAQFGRWSERQRTQWCRDGVLPVGAHPELGIPLHLGVTYLEDLERHRYNDALEDALATCRTPVAIITGAEDLVAPPADAKQLASKLQQCDRQEHIICATGHTFGIEHPASRRSPALEEALERTSTFFDAVCTAS
ncbi:MAG: hypothetical protein AA908_04735 [Chlorobi bacterium NICIL-2]|nr:MAG: hypothetical protein AA908_04735 [Chlorobi bacterium NICIL-2]